ncbi:MAG: CHRD domain-containing protein [Ilumatobacteraceae bacterium]
MKHSFKIAAGVAAGALMLAAAPADAGHGIAEQTIPLSSGQETGAGEPGGSGKITLEFYGPSGAVPVNHICYELSTKKVGAQIGLHIHEAARKVDGPVLVNLGAAAPTASGPLCVTVDDQTTFTNAVFDDLLESPTDYYVNYHTTAAPSGAIRGQLHGFGD